MDVVGILSLPKQVANINLHLARQDNKMGNITNKLLERRCIELFAQVCLNKFSHTCFSKKGAARATASHRLISHI